MKIVVIEACGWHLGYLGCYGNDWVATPNLDRLAVEGVVFDWHYADQPDLYSAIPWSQRSVATGRYQLSGQRSLPETSPIKMPQVVRCGELGHFAAQVLPLIEQSEPWLWIEGPSLLPPWNFDDDLLTAYFDEDDEEEGLVPWKDPPCDLVSLSEAERVELQNTYAAVVTLFDAQLGVIVDTLRAKQQLDEMLLCVTARAGFPLGEHGMIGAPRPSLHDELVHLPLVMRLPQGAEAGLRIAALTQPVDLQPTFLEAVARLCGVGHTPEAPDSGGVGYARSLWPLIRGEVEAVRPFAVAELRVGERASRILRTTDWVLHVPTEQAENEALKPQLFAKPDDRWEVNNLYQQQMERAEEMEQQLRAFTAEISVSEAWIDQSHPVS